ncbi:hypothetical protein GLOIN_2v1486571 [Rhizophagus irregularis DAOM 181602=DAOM 197198]|uniref:Uncharacterized protein n=1 Tax=Rhizophagus irregularis (strain DAOM 181602 / DAOM 197198 / MUCL 43194) TaxID=747089 RepID=A0A2P4P6M0_RHIID|nr:hypothetical protein GLOIN_2v1486571 [Rhizophagus irregularis DAOM 181602=DAOM 197198]POG61035.1 hypothetical protein GLOIN_2v1486571 [Rhizophagus irregularis DAOM 181602=DAOM 197198]|eukprot:XP_025167901.1 hypothetical protein GLOIN_2v1486571 [Rhizophagus irregularis DAOM 181602=DAOM 197198]
MGWECRSLLLSPFSLRLPLGMWVVSVGWECVGLCMGWECGSVGCRSIFSGQATGLVGEKKKADHKGYRMEASFGVSHGKNYFCHNLRYCDAAFYSEDSIRYHNKLWEDKLSSYMAKD